MSQLKAGATYVYERADGVTYAREIGAHPDERFEVGRDYTAGTYFGMPYQEVGKLIAMKQAAKTNPALREALERAIVIYELSRQDESIDHHPV